MASFAPQEIRVQGREMPRVEGVQDAPVCRRVDQLLAVLAFTHSHFVGSFDVHAASAKRVDQVVIHRVFVKVEADLHACACARAAWCSRRKRS